jgi:hypothetical protein
METLSRPIDTEFKDGRGLGSIFEKLPKTDNPAFLKKVGGQLIRDAPSSLPNGIRNGNFTQ